ncbi:MAG: hypothetical protein K2I81_03115 [Alphaproteobacteria bacterium]|nr:hypothetical protein [Alphaproteobacteria bacterium]
MAGNKKKTKPGFENMSKEEQRKYFTGQMARAKEKLEQSKKVGDEKGAKIATEIIQNLQGIIGRL